MLNCWTLNPENLITSILKDNPKLAEGHKIFFYSSTFVLFTRTSATICMHTLWSKVQTIKIESKFTLTVNGWSSTLPTAIAALSSNVFVAPVSTWWSFILYRSNHSLIFEMKTIVLEVAGRHFASTSLGLRQWLMGNSAVPSGTDRRIRTLSG